MSDTPITLGSEDDLPRTVRQQKEARARDQMAREILNAPRQPYPQAATRPAYASASAAGTATSAAPSMANHSMSNHSTAGYGHATDFDEGMPMPPGTYPPATVSRLELPFLHLVGFFMKAVFAAIPALLVLMLILWGVGQIAQIYLPWLVKMKILVTFPG